MNEVTTRYGASCKLSVVIDDATATTAQLFIGLPGETPVFEGVAQPFTAGVADLTMTPADTRIPLGTYKYQVNITYANGDVDKIPDASNYDVELPDFTVIEALDETEVV